MKARPSHFRRILLAAAPTVGAASVALLAVGGGQNTATPAEAGPVFGFVIIVNTNTDEDVNNNLCSLREAIVAASANVPYNGCSTGGAAVADKIEFNIGTGMPNIDIGSNMPFIAGPVIINGNTGGATRVELRGPGGGNVDGLILVSGAAGSQINRLVINGFAGGNAIIVGAANVTIKGNYIGTTADGTAPAPNNYGIRVTGAGITIGGSSGTSPGGSCTGDCNLISGSFNDGIYLFSETAADAVIKGNFIGTDVTGTQALGNGVMGIRAQAANVVIGGVNANERNLISGNGYAGATIIKPGAIVQGNFIGTDTTGMDEIQPPPPFVIGLNMLSAANSLIGGAVAGAGNVISANAVGIDTFEIENLRIIGNIIGPAADGATRLGNGRLGVVIEVASPNNHVGGLAAGEANIIAYQQTVGVRVDGQSNGPSNGNQVRGNSIYANAGKGIELINGGNNGIAPPVILATGSASGTACPNCTIDVYSDDEDEGRIYEGSTTADGTGDWTFSGSVTGPFVTATATDAANNTSEFSEPRTIPFPTPTPSPTPSLSPTPSPSPTPGPQLTQGDINCDDAIDNDDFVFLMEYAAGLDDGTQSDPCPDLDEALPAGNGAHPWGDVNCDEDVNAVDALYVLAHKAGIELSHPGCTAIGQTL